jgi:3-hydroxybutyryl-CoA dehydrogenase
METIMIIGAGFMGAGIAQVCAQAGFRVYLVDNDDRALASSRKAVADSLQKFFARGQLAEHPPEVLQRIHCGASFEPVSRVQWIIESVTEDECLKRDLFMEIDRRTERKIPLASNTSTIPIERLAAGLRHPERVLGLHFFGPVPMMGVVEVIRSRMTGDAVFEKGLTLVKSLGKRPLAVHRDIPGFILNRVFAAAFKEGLELVASGTASIEDIDSGMRLGYGWGAGPFQIADNAGIDTVLNVGKSMRALGEHHLVPDLAALEKMVVDGKLGKKAGQGFYSYDDAGKKMEN